MISIAVDGPSGAGKSTVARLLSKKLCYIYVDTGAMYRAIALFVLGRKISSKDTKAVCSCLEHINIDVSFSDGEQHIILNGEDVTSEIRTPEISMMASDVSAIAEVRTFLLSLQRGMAQKHNVIMDGRDIATVVLPNADIKFFLTASDEIRARRRYDELKEKGMPVDYNEVLSDLRLRDYNDSHRKVAPLKPSSEAIIVDSSDLTLNQVVDKMLSLIKEKIGE